MDALEEWEMMEHKVELTCDKTGGIGGRRGVNIDVSRLVCTDKREDGVLKVGEEAVVLVRDGAGKDIVVGEKVGVVHIERCELVVAHRVDLFDVVEGTFFQREIAI
jgi:hypothetical protein